MIRSNHRSGLSRKAIQMAVQQQVQCETLETRALFAAGTGTVTGTLYNDDNFDGAKQSYEAVNAGRQVYIDANHNGRVDSGETSTTTNSQGVYTFNGLLAGSYDIKRVLPSTAYRVTTSTASLTVSSGKTTTFDIGSTRKGEPTLPINGAITGVLFNDDNGSQTLDSFETVNPGRVVYLDANGNDKLDPGETSVMTDAYGRYAFLDLDAGSYRVRRVLPSGYHVTSAGARDNATTDVFAGHTSLQDIGSTALSVVAGKSYAVSDSGDEDNADPGSTIFVDLNHNGFLDAGEPSRITGTPGAMEQYSFALKPGPYRIVAFDHNGAKPIGYSNGYADVNLAAGEFLKLDLLFKGAPKD